MTEIKTIEAFLANKEIAVIGASTNKKKLGNLILTALAQKGVKVFPVNPKHSEIEEKKCYPDTKSLPASIKAAVISTHPEATEKIIENIYLENNISYIWFQPGSENPKIISATLQKGLNVIQKVCILMFVKPSSFPHNIHRFFKKVFGKYPR
jgi:uncharacterized protein